MTEEIIINGVNVAGCDRHCSDNHNIPNRCYSDINESYRDCKPKEYQCNFYVTCLEQEHKQMKSALKGIKQIIVINKDEFEHCLYHDYDEQILNKINEVLNDDRE